MVKVDGTAKDWWLTTVMTREGGRGRQRQREGERERGGKKYCV